MKDRTVGNSLRLSKGWKKVCVWVPSEKDAVVIKNTAAKMRDKVEPLLRTGINFLLCPGYVISVNDGDTHFIDASDLLKCYEVTIDKCISVDTLLPQSVLRRVPESLIILSPREAGDYDWVQKSTPVFKYNLVVGYGFRPKFKHGSWFEGLKGLVGLQCKLYPYRGLIFKLFWNNPTATQCLEINELIDKYLSYITSIGELLD